MLVSHLISVVDITIAGGTALTLRSLQTPPSALLGVAAVTRREHRYLLSLPLHSHNLRLCGVPAVRGEVTVCAERSRSLPEPVALRSQSAAVASLTEYLPLALITESAVQSLITNPCSGQRQHITAADNPFLSVIGLRNTHHT